MKRIEHHSNFRDFFEALQDIRQDVSPESYQELGKLKRSLTRIACTYCDNTAIVAKTQSIMAYTKQIDLLLTYIVMSRSVSSIVEENGNKKDLFEHLEMIENEMKEILNICCYENVTAQDYFDNFFSFCD